MTDDGFKIGWVGKTVGQRFRNIRIAMPADAPGSLDSQTYIDIVAYILQIQRNAARQSEADARCRRVGKDRHHGAVISWGDLICSYAPSQALRAPHAVPSTNAREVVGTMIVQR